MRLVSSCRALCCSNVHVSHVCRRSRKRFELRHTAIVQSIVDRIYLWNWIVIISIVEWCDWLGRPDDSLTVLRNVCVLCSSAGSFCIYFEFNLILVCAIIRYGNCSATIDRRLLHNNNDSKKQIKIEQSKRFYSTESLFCFVWRPIQFE